MSSRPWIVGTVAGLLGAVLGSYLRGGPDDSIRILTGKEVATVADWALGTIVTVREGEQVPVGWARCDGQRYDGARPEMERLLRARGLASEAGTRLPDYRGMMTLPGSGAHWTTTIGVVDLNMPLASIEWWIRVR
jgi:hypothetical protein